MNYLKLIKKFWEKDVEYNFKEKEITLYFYILRISQSLFSKNNISIPNAHIIGKFGWSKESLIRVKEKLKNSGLIDYRSGNGRGHFCIYEVIYVQGVKGRPTDMSQQYKTCDEDVAQKMSIHTSDAFQKAWNTLLQMPKWRNKQKEILELTLSKLSVFDERFATELIDRCIIGGWSGLVFSDTEIHYKRWLAMQKNNNEKQISDRRKNEIIRRAGLAISACDK